MKIINIIKALFSRKENIFIVKLNNNPRITPRLVDLKIHQTGYVTPWKYDVDTKELDVYAAYVQHPSGTMCMPVTRIGIDSFSVDTDFDYFGSKYEFDSYPQRTERKYRKVMEYDVRKTDESKFIKENPEIYRLSLELQQKLQEKGIAWHNPISDECCIDFGCCEQDMGKYIKRVPKSDVKWRTLRTEADLPKPNRELIIDVQEGQHEYRRTAVYRSDNDNKTIFGYFTIQRDKTGLNAYRFDKDSRVKFTCVVRRFLYVDEL